MDPAWKASFAAFLGSVGERPSSQHSIDRYPDNNGSYVPGNVRWATRMEQGNNKRNNVRFQWRGESRTLAQISRIEGCDRHKLYNDVVVNGIPLQDAIKRKRVPRHVTA